VRVAFSTLGRLSVQNINRALSNLVDLREQVSSGRKFQRASQDPVGAQRAILLTNEIASIGQYRDATESATMYLESSQGVLLDLGARLREVKSVALQQRNDTSDASTRKTTAVTVRSIRDQIVSLLNSQVNGRRLFSGHLTQTDPFVENAAGKIEYHGDDGLIRYRVGPGQEEITNITGSQVAGTSSAFLMSTADLTPKLTLSTSLAAFNRGTGVPAGKFTVDNGAGGTVTIDTAAMTTVGDVVGAINGAGLGLVAGVNTAGDGIDILNLFNPTAAVTVTDLQNGTAATALGIAGTSVGMLKGTDVSPALTTATPLADIPALTSVPPDSIRVLVGGSSITVDFNTPPVSTVGELINRFNSAVPQLTMSLTPGGTGLRIDGQQEFTIEDVSPGTSGAQIGIAGSARQARLFGSLESLEQALIADDGDGIEKSIAEIELVIDNVVRVQGTVASRLERLDKGKQVLDTHKTSAETRLSDVVSTEMAETITSLTQAQTVYQTALGTASTVYDLNLFRYVYR